MLKVPELGRVKTRLAEAIGADKALLIYRHLLRITLQQLSALPYGVQLWYEGNPAKLPVVPPGFSLYLQKGTDLGERMTHALATSFQVYPDEPAIVVGADCPDMFPVAILQAFERLDGKEVVIGPATDGGYYLLGMHRLHPALFQDIHWSTETVLTQTQQQIRRNSLSYDRLSELNDIDTFSDLQNSRWYYLLDTEL